MIQFDKVHLRFDSGISLRNLNISIAKKEFVYLFGESGCGKSSILKMIYLELVPNAGVVTVLDQVTSYAKRKDIAKIRQRIGMAFQDSKLLGDRDIYSNIALPLELQGMKALEVRQKVVARSDELGLRSRLSHYPHELSAGEQQRVSLARAMVISPDILLADEPTAHLDDNTAADVLEWLWKINAQGTTIILATHNKLLTKSDPSRTLTIVAGEVVEDRVK